MVRRARDHRSDFIYSTLRDTLCLPVFEASFHPSKSMLPTLPFCKTLGHCFTKPTSPYSLSKESTFTPVARTPRWTPVHCRSTDFFLFVTIRALPEFSFPQVKQWPLRVLTGFVACTTPIVGLSTLSTTSLTAAHSPEGIFPAPGDACKQWLRGLCGAQALETP